MDNITSGPIQLNFEKNVEQFIEKHPKDWDKIQEFIQNTAIVAPRKEAIDYLPRLQGRLVKEGVNHPIIETIDEIYNQRLKQTSFTDLLPPELMRHILTHFAKLDAAGWDRAHHHPFFQYLFKHPVIAADLLNKNLIPNNNKIELAKIAGPLLMKLDLNGSLISDQQLKEIFKVCPNIEQLNLSECYNLTDDAIKEDLPENLQTLNLSKLWTLTNAAIKNLPRSLQTLDLSSCFWLTDADIKDLPKGLKTLNLSTTMYSELTNAAIKDLPRGLQTLIIIRSRKLTDAAIKDLPENLKTLNISDWNKLTDEAIKDLPKGLLRLNLTSCERITGATFKDLPQNLQELELSRLDITDSSIQDLPKNLRMLNLSYCDDLTGEAIKYLPTGLETLDVTRCGMIIDRENVMLLKSTTKKLIFEKSSKI